MHELGKRIFVQNLVLRGQLSEGQWKAFLLRCVEALGMRSAGAPAVFSYPNEDGEGGQGHTILQPITTSFIVVDTWDAHDGAYLHLASCQKFNVVDLLNPVIEFGLSVDYEGRRETLQIDRQEAEPSLVGWGS